MQVLIIGCGYLGLRAARSWIDQGAKVSALTRSQERASQWRQLRLNSVVGDVLDPKSLCELPAADVCLYAVGYDRKAAVDKRTVYVDGLKNALTALNGKVTRWIYVSSTSVYGQDQGEVVDENSPCEPTSEGGQICLEAENLLLQTFADSKTQAVIVRLAGLYGPQRLIARVDQLRSGVPLSGNPDAWLNLIHVDDAVRGVLQAAQMTHPPGHLLLSDGMPLRRKEFYSAIAHQIGAREPVYSDSVDEGLNKRCDSSLSWKLLNLRPEHPNSIETLPEILLG